MNESLSGVPARLLAWLSRSSIGVDSGRAGLKLVEVVRGARGPRVLRHSIGPVPQGHGPDEAVAGALAQFRAALRRSPVTASVPMRAVSMRMIPLPVSDPAQMAKMLPFQVKKLTPLALADLACAAVQGRGAPPGQVLAAWARRDTAAPPVPAGAPRPAAAHAVPHAVALHVFAQTYGLAPAGQQRAIVDVGHSSVSVAVFDGPVLQFAREAACGLSDLGLASIGAEPQAASAASAPGAAATLERLAGHVRASFQHVFFTQAPHLVKPSLVMVAGGGSALASRLAGVLGIPCEALAPAVEGVEPALVARLAGAIGAALAPLSPDMPLDLLSAVAVHRGFEARDIPVAPSGMALAALLIVTLAHVRWSAVAQSRAAAAQDQVARIYGAAAPGPKALRGAVGDLADVYGRFKASRTLAAIERVLRSDPAAAVADGIVVDSLDLSAGGSIALSGSAASCDAVSRMLDRLSTSGLFANASLATCGAAREGDSGAGRVRFRVSADATDAVRPE